MYFQWLKLEYNNIGNGWTFQVSIFLFEYSILLTFYFIIYIEKEFWCYFYKFKYNYWGTLYQNVKPRVLYIMYKLYGFLTIK